MEINEIFRVQVSTAKNIKPFLKKWSWLQYVWRNFMACSSLDSSRAEWCQFISYHKMKPYSSSPSGRLYWYDLISITFLGKVFVWSDLSIPLQSYRGFMLFIMILSLLTKIGVWQKVKIIEFTLISFLAQIPRHSWHGSYLNSTMVRWSSEKVTFRE